MAELIRSIAILALPCTEQLAWLRSLGLGEPRFADELALELGEGALLVRQFERAGWLSSEARQAVQEVDAYLSALGGVDHEQFWHVRSLEDSADWVHVRALALTALMAI